MEENLLGKAITNSTLKIIIMLINGQALLIFYVDFCNGCSEKISSIRIKWRFSNELISEYAKIAILQFLTKNESTDCKNKNSYTTETKAIAFWLK